MSTSQARDEWLSLSEAADMLGMPPAMVRQCADRNEIPSRRTSGGHRRFRRADVEARLRQTVEPKQNAAAQLLVQSVMGRIRFTFTDHTFEELPWYQRFDDTAREAYRSLGRRVLELLLRALTNGTQRQELQREAIELGREYGSITYQSHVPVADAVRAFLFFRTLVDESVLQLAEVRGSHDHQDMPWLESLNQIQTITNEILPALIEAAHG
ncbi:MAG: helix-turn-helix domain-containing protein [Ktedonobacteraceae bacterium]|nr:helix-turn-helix domain-containing protein [Ktedonobacteraceae bacterium]